MYRFLFCVYVLLFLAINKCPAQSPVTVSFTDAECDFGLFPSSDPIKKANIIISNNGEGNLIIESAMAACSCTTVNYKSVPIKPGCSDTIFITYNGTDRWPGEFSRSLLIKSNAVNSPTRIVLKGYMYDDSGATIPDTTLFKTYKVLHKPIINYFTNNNDLNL